MRVMKKNNENEREKVSKWSWRWYATPYGLNKWWGDTLVMHFTAWNALRTGKQERERREKTMNNTKLIIVLSKKKSGDSAKINCNLIEGVYASVFTCT